ncbi:MAG: hypothetical protein ACOX4M_05410 [Acetivibrionales bacterium]
MNAYAGSGSVFTNLKKKYIHIYQCKPGDILADDVFDSSGILVIPRNTVINGNVIRRLNIYRVRQVSVYERQSVQVGNNRRIPRTIDINSCSRQT